MPIWKQIDRLKCTKEAKKFANSKLIEGNIEGEYTMALCDDLITFLKFQTL